MENSSANRPNLAGQVNEAFLRRFLSTGSELKAEISRIEGHALEHIYFKAFNVNLDIFRPPELIPQVIESRHGHFARLGPADASVVWRLRHPVDTWRDQRAKSGLAAYVENRCS